MKKRFLQKIDATILTKQQLKTIGGGKTYSCHCAGGGDSWTANYDSDLKAAIAAANRCVVGYCGDASGSLAGGPVTGGNQE